MKIVIKMLSTAEMRRRHKVAENGPVQAAIDSECMRYMHEAIINCITACFSYVFTAFLH